ncbi:hypothetical protein HYALB_00001871 [Hymenoscyphus albidus]|uniref:Mid2 domain-containing protein n=1 Tax=Hymenoscyphus albidus TaxID=595503 RepID=A0A9N9LMP8_9HELO|nr:hypothetical protein HYALB_00001871 [Hymenoscyphus albidus]
MRRFYHISLRLVSCISACLATEFINPPAEDDRRDSSVNAVYAKGATINIQWTAVDAILAVTLFQLNKTDPRQFLLGLEYIATSLAPNTTSFTWTVQTRKSLEESPIFYMNLFVQGETSGRANSHAFNISLPGGVQPQSSSIRESPTSSLVTVDATSTPSSAPMATTTPVLAPLSTASPTSTNTPITATEGGLSGIGKIGVGIGVSAAVVLGVTVGWLFFGRKGRADKADITSTVAPQIYYESKYDSVSQPVMPYQRAHELPPNTTAESRYELSGQR